MTKAIMNGSDMEMVTRKLNEEAIRLADQEDKLVTSFVTENFDNVLGPEGILHGYHEKSISDAFSLD